MSDVVYKVEFDVNQITNENEEITESVSRSPKPKTTPSKKGFITEKSAKPIMFAWGAYKMGQAAFNRQEMNNMTLRGDNLAARMYQERTARQEKYINSGFTLAMGIAIKGTIGGMFIAMEAFKLATEAINISVENRNLLAQMRMEKYINSIEQTRFVRNTTTESIRW